MCSHYTFTTHLASEYVRFSPSHLKKYICCDTVSYHHVYLISNWICSCLFLVFFWLCPQCEWKWGMQAWRECWEERKQPGWHVDWRIANRSQTGRNPCQLCLPTPPSVRLSESVAVMLADIQTLLPAVKIYSFVSITLSVTASVVNMTQ